MCRSRRRWPLRPLTPPPPPPDFYVERSPRRMKTRAAFSSQMDLEDKVSNIVQFVESGDCNQADLKKALLSIQGNVGELGDYFSREFARNPEFYNERRADDFAIACRVFEIPELMEMILEHLQIPDVLVFYQCGRSIRDSINASSKLQQQLSLRAAPSENHLRLPLWDMTKSVPNSNTSSSSNFTPLRHVGFSSSYRIGRRIPRHHWVEYNSKPDDRTVEIHASFHVHQGQILPSMGSRIRQMLITQPPIQEMNVSLDCCPTYESALPPGDRSPAQKVSRDGGLTVGDLYGCAEKLLNEHRFCPMAYSGLLEDDGTVRVGVRFIGRMVLQSDDPIYVGWCEDRKRRERRDRAHHKKTSKLEAFCIAKRTAHANGEPIPLFKDFVASHGEDADWQKLASPAIPGLQNFDFDSFLSQPSPPPLQVYNAPCMPPPLTTNDAIAGAPSGEPMQLGDSAAAAVTLQTVEPLTATTADETSC